VVSSAGGESAKVASGVRIWVEGGREAGILDDYQFAGNGFIVFDDDTGSLYSAPVDGSAPPFQVAPRLGQSSGNDSNVPVPWRLLVDGRIFFNDFAGTYLAGPDGRNAVLFDSDQGLPWCGIRPDGFLDRCAVSSDGKSVLLSYATPDLTEAGGKLSVNPDAGQAFWLKQVSLDDPAGPKPRIDSSRAETVFAADDAVVFYDAGGNLVRRTADGAQALLLAPGPAPLLNVLQYQDVSPDLRWSFFGEDRGPRPFADPCFNCSYGTFVSLVDGTRWEPMDPKGGRLQLWQEGWSPDSSRLLIIGPVARTNQASTDAGGTLYVVASTGGPLTPIDENVDHFTWVDDRHAVIERMTGHGHFPAGTFVREIP
ncbi:MAG TPA: hypothetical protein VLW85_13680, partial [Myxococcales bacterium]|nr:hypothetical protein [Myxococcales bacterium]